MIVFFYGLFMDETLLHTKGVRPVNMGKGQLAGYALTIGDRASLMPDAKRTAYGILMEISSAEARALYAEDSVADYGPEKVVVLDKAGQQQEAICYNLPQEKLIGHNSAYATKLLSLAQRLNFPDDYLDQIKKWL